MLKTNFESADGLGICSVVGNGQLTRVPELFSYKIHTLRERVIPRAAKQQR